MYRTDPNQWHAQAINKVEIYLENHYADPFGIPQIAEQVHLSYHHLAAIFQQSRGEALGSYLVRKKLERAATLYVYTPMNIAEVADQTGYASKHSLSKAFTQHFGISPGSFLKNSLYRPHSPNIVLDGFHSRKEYETLMGAETPFEYAIENFEHCWLVGQLGIASEQWERAFEQFVSSNKDNKETTTRYCLKAFDSVNFSPLTRFRMLAGRFYSGIASPEAVEKLRNQNPGQLVLPVKDGRYLRFEVPPGSSLARQRSITICREQLILQKKLFILHDFYDFFLFSTAGSEQGGHYYMRLG